MGTSADYFSANFCLNYIDSSLERFTLAGAMHTKYELLAFLGSATQEDQSLSFYYYDNKAFNYLRKKGRSLGPTARFTLPCGDGIKKTIAEVICGMHDTEIVKTIHNDKNKVYCKK